MVIVPFSGGLRSVAIVFKLLHDTQRDETIHLHHVCIKTTDGLWIPELRAVQNHFNLFQGFGGERIETSISRADLIPFGPCGAEHYATVMLHMAMLLKSRIAATSIAWGYSKEFYEKFGQQRVYLKKAIFSSIAGDPLVEEYPIHGLSYNDIADCIPSDYRTNVWSCLSPTKQNLKYVSCGKCWKCDRNREIFA